MSGFDKNTTIKKIIPNFEKLTDSLFVKIHPIIEPVN
jgi:hypothetical protein